MDESILIAGVVLSPLIIGWVQVLKRFAPDASGNLWLGLVLFFGVVLSMIAQVANEGTPGSWQGWLGVVVIGLFYGLATSKLYDETVRKAE